MQSETSDTLNVVTEDWITGNKLKLICHDRDLFTGTLIIKKEVVCIFTVKTSDNFYDSILVEAGTLKTVSSEKIKDNLFSEFVINGEFAKYKNKIFRSISGYQHTHWFKLWQVMMKVLRA